MHTMSMADIESPEKDVEKDDIKENSTLLSGTCNLYQWYYIYVKPGNAFHLVLIVICLWKIFISAYACYTSIHLNLKMKLKMLFPVIFFKLLLINITLHCFCIFVY